MKFNYWKTWFGTTSYWNWPRYVQSLVRAIGIPLYLATLFRITLVSAGEQPLLPASFEVAGAGGTESFSPVTMAKTSESSRIFSARFSNSLWMIRFVGPSTELDYVEMGTDGTNIFTVKSTESRYRRELSEGRQHQNSGQGAVRRGPVPNELAHPHAGMLWFAFASQAYFRTNGIAFLQPLLFAEANSDILLYYGFRQKAQFEPWSTVESRPRRAVWFHDGLVRYWERRDFAKVSRHLEKPWHEPYNKGFTNAVFEATDPKDEGGFSVPKRLDYWVYCPRPKAQTNTDLAVIQHHWLLITNVQVGTTSRPFVPMPPEGSTLVADERFVRAEGSFVRLNYPQNGGWLSDDDAAKRLLDLNFKEQSRLATQANAKDVDLHRNWSVARLKPAIVLVVVLLTPIIWFVIWRKTKTQNTTTNRRSS